MFARGRAARSPAPVDERVKLRLHTGKRGSEGSAQGRWWAGRGHPPSPGSPRLGVPSALRRRDRGRASSSLGDPDTSARGAGHCPRRRRTTAPSEPCAASIFPAHTQRLAETKPALEQNFLRVCFEPAGRRAAEEILELAELALMISLGSLWQEAGVSTPGAAVSPKGAVNLLFFP